MKIEYFHASKYGNGAKVAEEFQRQMAAKGVTVNVHHVKSIKPKEIPPADLYLFSSPGRFGKPIGDMRGFLKEGQLAIEGVQRGDLYIVTHPHNRYYIAQRYEEILKAYDTYAPQFEGDEKYDVRKIMARMM